MVIRGKSFFYLVIYFKIASRKYLEDCISIVLEVEELVIGIVFDNGIGIAIYE